MAHALSILRQQSKKTEISANKVVTPKIKGLQVVKLITYKLKNTIGETKLIKFLINANAPKNAPFLLELELYFNIAEWIVGEVKPSKAEKITYRNIPASDVIRQHAKPANKKEATATERVIISMKSIEVEW